MFTEHLSNQNNRESQQQIEDNMFHFGKQAQTVFDHLMSGDSIDGDMAKALYQIRDLRPRIGTIKKAGFDFTPTTIPKTHGMKVFHMTDEQISHNKELLKRLKK